MRVAVGIHKDDIKSVHETYEYVSLKFFTRTRHACLVERQHVVNVFQFGYPTSSAIFVLLVVHEG